jgi:Zn-dependent protease with chaperone function
MVSLSVILLVIPLLMGGYARKVEAGGGDVPDKVHRIGKAQVAAILTLPVLGFVMLAEFYGEARLLGLGLAVHLSARHDGAAVAAGALLVYFIIVAAGAVLCYLGAYSATARLRALDVQPRRAGRRQLRFMMVILVPQVIWAGLLAGAHELHGTAQVAVLPLWIAYLVAIIVFWPRLMPAMLRTKPLDGDVRQHVLGLASKHQVRVKDIRCLDTGPEQTANAMVTGLLPGNRHVFVTDRLLHDLEPSELDAVLAHEMAHAKKHHLLIKVGAILVAWLPATAAGIALGVTGRHLPAALIVGGLVLVMILAVASFVVVQGIVGLRLERSADDYASALAGPDALRRGLEKVASANAAKRNTGRLWNIITQHPGLDQRIERLRQASIKPRSQH